MQWIACLVVAIVPIVALAGETVPPTPVCIWADSSPAADQIQAALDRPLADVGLEFQDTPLEEVVAVLRDQYEIEIQIDMASLDEVGLAADEPIAVNLRNVTLRAALTLMLKQHELGYVVENEVLLITTQREVATRLRPAVYPVSDITASVPMSDLRQAVIGVNYSAMGEGSEGQVMALGDEYLIVSTTEEVHRYVAGLLIALRKAKAQTSASADAQATSAPVVTH